MVLALGGGTWCGLAEIGIADSSEDNPIDAVDLACRLLLSNVLFSLQIVAITAYFETIYITCILALVSESLNPPRFFRPKVT